MEKGEMRRKIALGIMLTLLLVGVLTLAFDLVVARVDGYASIRADSSSASSEPPAIQWNKTYGGDDYDWGGSVQQTSDGGYIVAGTTYSFGAGYADLWLVKADASGNMMWNKTYGGADYDTASSVQQTSDGGYIVAGYTESPSASDRDFWLVKTDGAGNHQWNITYGGANDDWANSVQQTSDGGYIVAGTTNSFGAGSDDFWLVKLAPPPPPVGGIWIPVDKLALLTPWIILAVATVAITITLAYAKKRWTGKAVVQKQK